MRVAVFGAGSTAGTLPGVPWVTNFVRRLEQVHPSWRADYPALAQAVADCPDGAGLDVVWTRIDYFAKLWPALGRPDYGAECSVQLHKAVAEVYSLEQEIRTLLVRKRHSTLRRILEALRPGDLVVSFNWDTLLEQLAASIGLDLVQAPSSSPTRSVRIVKPHGSLSWVHGPDQEGGCSVKWHDAWIPLVKPIGLDRINLASPHFTQPLLLGAVPIKSELVREVQRDHPQVFLVVTQQWHEVVEAVVHADSMSVVGYRFPEEDAYGAFLLKEAVRRRPQGASMEIDVFALKPQPTLKTIQAIFGDVSYRFRGPVEPPS